MRQIDRGVRIFIDYRLQATNLSLCWSSAQIRLLGLSSPRGELWKYFSYVMAT